MGLGCNDPNCCPEPRIRTKEEKLLDSKLGFINNLAEVYYSSGNRLDEIVIPEAYVELKKRTDFDFLNIYQSDYGPVIVRNGKVFGTKVSKII